MRRQKKIVAGKPLPFIPKPHDIIRFLKKVAINSGGCWVWSGYMDEHGYGQFKCNGRAVWAHRFAVEVFKGALAAGQEADHQCRNPSCVNPEHLCGKSMPDNRATRTKETAVA